MLSRVSHLFPRFLDFEGEVVEVDDRLPFFFFLVLFYGQRPLGYLLTQLLHYFHYRLPSISALLEHPVTLCNRL